MHMVDLPDAQAARVFAFQEPFYQAGVYRQVLLRRWRNLLGRTMWDYPAELGDDRRFLVIGHGKPGTDATRLALAAAQRRWFGEPAHRDGVILGGPLLADDGAGWVGSALLVQLGDRAAVAAMLAGAPEVRGGLYASVEIHDWQFGGRCCPSRNSAVARVDLLAPPGRVGQRRRVRPAAPGVLDRQGEQGRPDWSRASVDAISVHAKRGGPGGRKSGRSGQARVQAPPGLRWWRAAADRGGHRRQRQ
jgi:uncharacterized protein